MADRPSIQPSLQAAAALDTSEMSQILAIRDASDDQQSGELSPTGRVMRVVEKTVDKLGRSISGKAAQKSAPQCHFGHRRVFSLSRKNRQKQTSDDIPDGRSILQDLCDVYQTSFVSGDADAYSESSLRTPTRSTSPQSSLSPTAQNDESPFIRPPSPPPPPSRPSLQSFRGNGSVRLQLTSILRCYLELLLLNRCVLEHRRLSKLFK
jgi:sterol 3beta-glucosyltransferase